MSKLFINRVYDHNSSNLLESKELEGHVRLRLFNMSVANKKKTSKYSKESIKHKALEFQSWKSTGKTAKCPLQTHKTQIVLIFFKTSGFIRDRTEKLGILRDSSEASAMLSKNH